MNEEERRKYEAFQYWIQTNTEKGVTTIPDTLCLFVVNLINKLQKENEEKDKIIDLMAKEIYIEADKDENPEEVKKYFEKKVKG